MNTSEQQLIELQSLAELENFAGEILRTYPRHKIILLRGDLGAGKTSLAQAICRHLRIEEQAKSPSFAIINEYHSPDGPVYHFDFYRIEAEEEAQELGLEEYWESGNHCLVEWPEMIPSYLPAEYLSVSIELTDSGSRKIQVCPYSQSTP